ncbi:hypothetical protein JP75_02090 [Devosia riboflavina]|uniref:HTH lysR-type domain-containing protein n=2 Tax=Devosia riboflavina TaxID=46914 RepID=A0A087M7U0_9HYPH|nr:hypothetical protein JP75_02090 [Devosia riboflavina]
MSLRLNFRHLEMFRLLMKTSNLTETARLMRVSQPAISHALRELEGQLGLTLFVRAAGRIRATPEAIDLLPEVDRLFGQISLLNTKAEHLKDAQGGRLDIAAIPVLAMAGIPEAICQFRTQRPFSHILLQSVATTEVITAVKEESVNLGFIATPIQDPSVGVEPLLETEFCCFLPAGHPLAEHDEITASHFEGETLIALSTHSPPGYHFRSELAKSKKDQLVALETNNAFVALSLVEAGAGIGVLDPMPYLGRPAEGIVIRPFKPSVSITFAAVFSRHRSLSRMELQFIETTRKCLHESAKRLTALGISAVTR